MVLVVVCFSALVGCSRIPFVRDWIIKDEERKTRNTEIAIENSPLLQDLNRVCTEISKPEGFTLVRKSMGGKIVDFLELGYHSNMEYREAKSFYIGDMSKQGWQFLGENEHVSSQSMEFQKDGYSAEIGHFYNDDGINYSFICKKIQN